MPDYMFLLESRISPEQHAALARVQELAQSQAMNVYLTGGAVRDLISGAPIRDLDFTVEGNPAWIVRELVKGGARVAAEDSRLRETELIFGGDVDGSVSQARDEIYDLPGTRPRSRWATIMDDLRRRDFSINAIAISLNPGSRGLLLDPTNGLADIERREVRTLSIHCFTNQPVRLLRVLRYAARLDFKMESRTQERFELALERGLLDQIPPAQAGAELRQLGEEEHPAAVLRAWEARDLLAAIHPQLARRYPDYEGLKRLTHAAEQVREAGLKPRLLAPVTWYALRRLKQRERTLALHKLGFRAEELAAIAKLEAATREALRALKGRQTATPKDAYNYLERLPREVMTFLGAEFSNPRANAKIRNYLHKWRPMRRALPEAELEALGVPRGSQFDRILLQFFELELKGKGKAPVDRTRILRRLAGIKEPKPAAKKAPKPGPESKSAPMSAPAARTMLEKDRKQVPAGTPARGKSANAAKPHRPVRSARSARR